jgi:hypothetical protein
MTAPNIGSTMRQSAQDQAPRELPKKEWRRPDLRKLPIAATAHSAQSGKSPGVQDDGGMGAKAGDIRHLS